MPTLKNYNIKRVNCSFREQSWTNVPWPDSVSCQECFSKSELQLCMGLQVLYSSRIALCSVSGWIWVMIDSLCPCHTGMDSRDRERSQAPQCFCHVL